MAEQLNLGFRPLTEAEQVVADFAKELVEIRLGTGSAYANDEMQNRVVRLQREHAEEDRGIKE
jgi:hypothetical protein